MIPLQLSPSHLLDMLGGSAETLVSVIKDTVSGLIQ